MPRDRLFGGCGVGLVTATPLQESAVNFVAALAQDVDKRLGIMTSHGTEETQDKVIALVKNAFFDQGDEVEAKQPSAKELAALKYLDHLMEAPARSVGRAIYDAVPGSGSSLAALGAAVCVGLRRRGLVRRLPELRAWRISAEGRKILRLADGRKG